MDAVNRQSTKAAQRIFAQSHVILVCFFFSGFAALIYQVAWQRLVLRILGSTLPAVSLVLAVFMAGLALGSFINARLWPKISNPLKAYAVIELAVGAAGLLSLLVFRAGPDSLCAAFMSMCGHWFGTQTFAPQNPFDWHFVLRAAFVGTFLLIPTTFMGASFTVIGAYFERYRSLDDIKSPSASAYLANLLGAASGTICSGFLLLPNFGLTWSILTAVLICLLVAVVAFLTGKSAHAQLQPEGHSFLAGKTVLQPKLLCAIAFITGLSGLILEVVWTRLFCLLLGSSTYSLSAVVSVCMIGLVLGTAWMHSQSSRIKDEMLVTGALLCGLAFSSLIDLWIIQACPWLFASLHFFMAATFAGYLFERIVLIALIVLPPSALTGAIFPLLLKAISSNWNDRERSLGLIYSFNALGSVFGALLTGLVLLPYFGSLFASGMESTICLVAGLALLTGLVLFVVGGKRRLVAIPVLLLILTLVVRPAWNRSLIAAGVPFLTLPPNVVQSKALLEQTLSDSASNKLLFYREGLNTTVTVQSAPQHNVIYLKNDGKVEAALPIVAGKESSSSDLITHQMLGQLPFICCAPVHKAFVVGLGSGATSGAALTNTELTKLTVAEVEPAIYAAQNLFEATNGSPLRKQWLEAKRVIPLCEDARTVLNFSNEKFDAIISQPAEPWVSGSADLYSVEFWQLCKSRLEPEGVFSQWIQLYAIDPEYLGILCRTFQSVFPYTYAVHPTSAGEMILLGCARNLDETQVKRLKGDLIATPLSLRETCQKIGAAHRNWRINTDDNMTAEYGLPQRLYLSEDLIDKNLQAIGTAVDPRLQNIQLQSK